VAVAGDVYRFVAALRLLGAVSLRVRFPPAPRFACLAQSRCAG
jgi:hypothetical protein